MAAVHSTALRRPLAALTAAMALALTLAGCSSTPGPDAGNGSSDQASPIVSSTGIDAPNGGATDGGSYAAMFEQARQEATSDFERQVLEDNQITRAEYEEAVQRFVKCFTDKGINVKAEDQDGFYRFSTTAADDARFQQEEGTCAEGTVALIEPLYIQTQQNPNNQDMSQLTADCLVNTGLADPSFDGEKLDELMAQGQNAKWPFDTEDPRFPQCINNPNAAQNK